MNISPVIHKHVFAERIPIFVKYHRIFWHYIPIKLLFPAKQTDLSTPVDSACAQENPEK
jgi:hypothetical protein